MRKTLTQEEFLEKARKIHGDKYDYSKSIYINNHTKIDIMCPEHGEFHMTPRNHLIGQGCRTCGYILNTKKRTKTIEQFILDAQAIHHNKYDYSKVVYVNSSTPIIIICEKHGEFIQVPSEHLYGYGCIFCGREIISSKLIGNTDKFISKAIGVHGDRYDYSKVNYINSATEVEIICLKHGSFFQKPVNHLVGHGCLICGGSLKKSLDEFIAAAKAIYGEKYDYSNVVYVNTHTKVNINCPKHGSFYQYPNDHIGGHGCIPCGYEFVSKTTSKTIEQFILEANEVHKNKYDYSEAIYKNAITNVIILCPKHGAFLQTPASHLSGNGCNNCSKIISNISNIWLDYIGIPDNKQHREVKLIHGRKFKVDGYMPETNTIYEFYGDAVHGNPSIYDSNDTNKKWNVKYGELYKKTMEREEIFKKAGYNIVTIWETDFKEKYFKINKENKWLLKKKN